MTTIDEENMDRKILTGISWDDDKDNNYFATVKQLLPDHISITITDDHKQFEDWIDEKEYDFVLLDIFLIEHGKPANDRPIGIGLSKKVLERHPKMPIIVATSYFDLIPQDVWKRPTNVYLWSKTLRSNWFASDLEDILEYEGIAVSNSVLIVSETLIPQAEQLQTELKKVGVQAKVAGGFELGNWPKTVHEIISYGSFVVFLPEPTGTLLIDAIRISSLHRGPERMIVVGNQSTCDLFSNLEQVDTISTQDPELIEKLIRETKNRIGDC